MSNNKKKTTIKQVITFEGRCVGCGKDIMNADAGDGMTLSLCAWDTGLGISLPFCVPCAENAEGTLHNGILECKAKKEK